MGELVRRLSVKHDNIKTHIRYSTPVPADRVGHDYDDQGHVDIELVKRLVSTKDCDFYVCGPTPFMKSLLDVSSRGVCRNSAFITNFSARPRRSRTGSRSRELSAPPSDGMLRRDRSYVFQIGGDGPLESVVGKHPGLGRGQRAQPRLQLPVWNLSHVRVQTGAG